MFWAWLKAEIEKRVVRLDTSGILHFAPEAFGGRLHLARFEGAVLGLVLASQYAGARLKTGKVRRPDLFQRRRRDLMGGCLALRRLPTRCISALHPYEAVHREAHRWLKALSMHHCHAAFPSHAVSGVFARGRPARCSSYFTPGPF